MKLAAPSEYVCVVEANVYVCFSVFKLVKFENLKIVPQIIALYIPSNL